jgi:hypothetical protein
VLDLLRNCSVREGISGLLEYQVYEDYEEFVTRYSFEIDSTSSIAYSLCYALLLTDDWKRGLDINKMPRILGKRETDEFVPKGQYTRQVAERLFLDCKNANIWLRDLVAANQTRSLSSENIARYFAQVSDTRVIGMVLKPIIDYASNRMPKILKDDAAFESLTPCDWVRQHTSFSSNARLATRVISYLGTDKSFVFSASEIEAVEKSFEKPYDAELNWAIPILATAKVMAALEAWNWNVDGWYQGQKAKEYVRGCGFYERYVNYFTRRAQLEAKSEIQGREN